MKHADRIRKLIQCAVDRCDDRRGTRTCARPGLTFIYANGEYQGCMPAVAPWLPNVKGMRYQKGRLIPRR